MPFQRRRFVGMNNVATAQAAAYIVPLVAKHAAPAIVDIDQPFIAPGNHHADTGVVEDGIQPAALVNGVRFDLATPDDLASEVVAQDENKNGAHDKRHKRRQSCAVTDLSPINCRWQLQRIGRFAHHSEKGH